MGCIGAMFGAVGCASKDVVRKDAPVVVNAPVVKTVSTPTVIDTKKEDLKKPAAIPSTVTQPTSKK
jgi:hypothetical protein